MTEFDLIIAGGRVIDPVDGIDAVHDVGISGGRIVEVGSLGSRAAAERFDATGLLVVPGLIDMHGHYVPDAHPMAVHADVSCPPSGITTAVDAGTVGWGAAPSLERQIRESRTRIFGLLHLSMIGLLPAPLGVAELYDMRLVNPDRVAEVLRASDRLVGLKVRVTPVAFSRTEDIPAALGAARAILDETGGILMLHVSGAPIPLAEIFRFTRSGDVITHAFHGTANGILGADGRVLPEVRDARAAGVLFDVGHAGAHFDLEVATAAARDGFWPDTMGTDIHVPPAGRHAPSILEIIDIFLGLGMPVVDAVRAATTTPARALGKQREIGTLRPGAVADIAVLRTSGGSGEPGLSCVLTVRDGVPIFRPLATEFS
jgi:dihydroorotase